MKLLNTAKKITTATDDGAVEVWCTDALDGDDWFLPSMQKPICGFMTGCNSL